MTVDKSERLRAALAELVHLKDLKDEHERRKQRRLHWLRRDPDEVAELARMKSSYDQRKPLAWAEARAALVATAGST